MSEELAGYAPLALGEAERALRTAETWTGNNTYRIHLIYMADRRIQIARVVAQRAQLEDEYIRLNEERNDLLVRASQLEAERARFEAEQARLISEAQAEDARRAREEAEAAAVREAESQRSAQQAQEEAAQARALAVERERAIAENELQNQIELARREEDLVAHLVALDLEVLEILLAGRDLDADPLHDLLGARVQVREFFGRRGHGRGHGRGRRGGATAEQAAAEAETDASLPVPIRALETLTDGAEPITTEEHQARLDRARALMAEAAGLGWQGKHTNLLGRDLGNWIFLGAIFTTLDLPADAPEEQHCGTCTACLDICPTHCLTITPNGRSESSESMKVALPTES